MAKFLDAPEKVVKNADKLYKKTSYDIRAYVGEPGNFFTEDAVMTPDTMRVTGTIIGCLAFKDENGKTVQLNEGDTVVIGYDNGPTSEALAAAMAEGFNSVGVNVYDIGVSSSGQVYQNQNQLGAQAHVQITRSHVEVTTNGAKFGIGIQGIHTYLLGQMNEALKNNMEIRECEPGEVIDKKEEGKRLYFDKMRAIYSRYFTHRDNSEVAINLFGGTGVQYADLFRLIFGEQVTILGEDLNVNEGHLLADPTRKEMVEKVEGFQISLDVGRRIHSFDLDADRGSITMGANALEMGQEGHYLGDMLCYILAEHKMKVAVPRLSEKLDEMGVIGAAKEKIIEKAKVVYIDPRYTSSIRKVVADLGGYTEFHPKGHSLWKETITKNMLMMAETAGCESIGDFVSKTGYRDLQIEASLHFFSTDTVDGLPRDDSVENIFILEQVLDEMKATDLKEYFRTAEKRFMTKEIRTVSADNEVKEKITWAIIEKIEEMFKDKEGCTIVNFPGQIRVDWDDGYIMYGMSNTSPKLTFMAEGTTELVRNKALAFILALHNHYKNEFGDNEPMDLSENDFFIKDKSFEMDRPDEMTLDKPRPRAFMSRFDLEM